jgi:hypothetical protein
MRPMAHPGFLTKMVRPPVGCLQLPAAIARGDSCARRNFLLFNLVICLPFSTPRACLYNALDLLSFSPPSLFPKHRQVAGSVIDGISPEKSSGCHQTEVPVTPDAPNPSFPSLLTHPHLFDPLSDLQKHPSDQDPSPELT